MFTTSVGLMVAGLSAVALSDGSSQTSTFQTITSTGAPHWGLTTVFTEPTGCSDGITELAQASWGLWHNIVYPAPSVTVTSCYPSAFLASAAATVDTPPFEQLVCPYNWESYDYNSTYVICCPSGYGLYAPEWKSNIQRPGLGAVCTSRVHPGLYIDTWSYNSVGHSTLIGTTLDETQFLLVQATAFDGITFTPVATSTSTSTTSSTSSWTPSKTSTSTTSSTSTMPPSTTSSVTPTSTWSGATAVSQLPSCGQTCFGNMLGQYKALGCSTDDPACLCRNVDFGNGIRDCSNGACGQNVGSTVIAFETGYYCPSAIAARTTMPTTSPTPTAIAQLPECGQTCFKNMLGQYSQLGCEHPDATCLCKKPNFGYGLRDCANGACGTDVGGTVIAYASNGYCATATPAP